MSALGRGLFLQKTRAEAGPYIKCREGWLGGGHPSVRIGFSGGNGGQPIGISMKTLVAIEAGGMAS